MGARSPQRARAVRHAEVCAHPTAPRSAGVRARTASASRIARAQRPRTGLVAPAQAQLVDERAVRCRLDLLLRGARRAVGELASGIGVTFFVGSIFFTSAAYLQYSEAVNVEHRSRPEPRRRWRPASWEPHRIDWVASSVQLVGTVFFNVSTFAAMKHGFTTHQTNRARVGARRARLDLLPDLQRARLRRGLPPLGLLCNRTLSWWIVALNMLGSIAFGVAAIASLVEPSSGRADQRADLKRRHGARRALLPDRRARADAGGGRRGEPQRGAEAAVRRRRRASGNLYSRLRAHLASDANRCRANGDDQPAAARPRSQEAMPEQPSRATQRRRTPPSS